jgi:ABC-type multidrug transport system fused ATPase/permease subunit
MTPEQFVLLQEGLFDAFGWLARWWLILFMVGGMAMAAFMFFLQVVSTWLETR